MEDIEPPELEEPPPIPEGPRRKRRRLPWAMLVLLLIVGATGFSHRQAPTKWTLSDRLVADPRQAKA